MSNLGAYQWMTTAAKKVGGPVNLLLLAGTAGAAIYKGGETVVKQCAKAIRAHKSDKPVVEAKSRLYKVTATGKSNEGLAFAIGDQFRVLETDGDAVLIEKIGDKNNPYFVSAELLHRISDYKELRRK